jgi:hypothetical protein
MVEAVSKVRITPSSDEAGRLWALTLELSEVLAGLPWTIIGAHMVLLHLAEAGIQTGRTSADVDFLVDVRAVSSASADASTRLVEAGFELSAITPDGRGMRFERQGLLVDILAPDHLGVRARTDTVDGARTIEVPGGTQALQRSEDIRLAVGKREATVPRPNLLGAILLKSRAVAVSDDRDKHLQDLVRLLDLVRDPGALRREMTRTERAWLARRSELVDPTHSAWAVASRPDDAYLALRALLGKATVQT